MKLRTYVTLLMLAALLPVAIFAAAVGYFLIDEQRDTFRRGAEQRALALLTAVDAELKGSIDTIEALSLVASLADGDLRSFRQTATRILAHQPHWININLALPDRQRVVDLLAAEGAPLPPITDFGEIPSLLRAQKAVVGDLALGPVSKKWNYGLRVPVIREGEVKYVLSAVAKPEPLAELLKLQNLPDDWIGMIVDRQGRVVARNVNPAQSVGQSAPPDLAAALSGAASGWVRVLQGDDYQYRYQVSKTTGWAFALGIPSRTLDAVAWQAVALFVIGLVSAMALAIGLARFVGRRISRPIAALAAATGAMAQGEPVALADAGSIAELRSLEAALRAAGRAQEALRRAEEQSRSLVDHVVDGIVTIDERGNVESFNPAAERLFGLPASEVIGRNVKMLMPEPYRAGHDGYIANYLRTGEAKIIGIGREVLGRRSDGTTFPMDLAVSEFRIGQRRFFTGIVRDITDRKRAEESLRASEERLRLAIAAGRMGSWQWNVQTGEVIWSPELEAIHGLAPGSFARTFAAYEADIHPDDRDKVRQAIARNLKEGDDHHVEYRILWPDGGVRWVEGRGRVYRDDKGALTRVIGVCSDITQRKHAEESLKEADRQKDEFLAMLSHELRNPLSALTTAAHVLRVGAPGDAASAGAQGVVERQTRHMVRLVEDLLDITRVRMGKVSLRRERMNLAEVVSEALQSWRLTGRLGGRASLSLDASPVWIYADRARIEQIFSNLLDNALKFTPASGYIKVNIRHEGDEAVLHVTDSGRGITPQALTVVFEPFVQGEHPSGRSESGLGLGLTLVRRLTELHGGSVSAASDGINRGATFTARFPAVAPPSESGLAPARPALVARPRRILLIEDNHDARLMLRAALALDGHEVRDVSDGAGAIAAAAGARWDAAVIDIGLPDIDGYEVARRLRSTEGGAAMTLVALSGYGKEADAGRARDAGFDAYLMKPVSAERLCQVIAQTACA
ncbi:MAG: PAS domain S-box protein [Betaproteobacteria bacterium]|nr:MAG: PAS domain S-box protein [Betaproteobacteria bacterium]